MNKKLKRTVLGISIIISVVLILLFISYNMEINNEKKENEYTEKNKGTETEEDTGNSQKESEGTTEDTPDEDTLTENNKVRDGKEVNPFPNDKFDHSGLSSERFNVYLSLMEDDSSEITEERIEWLIIGLEFVEEENREDFKERINELEKIIQEGTTSSSPG